MSVHRILIVAILVIGATFIALALIIILNKAWRDSDRRWRRSRRRKLEPIVERYLARLTDRNWWHRAEAAERLGLAVARRTIDELTRALEDEVAEVRFRAARALGQLGGIPAVRLLIGALDRPDRWSTIRIADVLASMGPEVGDELTHAFSNLGPRARAAALDILAAVGHVQAGPWIRERLGDDDSDVRSRAANALGAIGDMQAGQPLVAALDDPEWPVRAMAAKSLGLILHLPAIQDLCAALRDTEWWVRVNAAEALRLMGPEGLTALESMLVDKDAYARHQAVYMLQESGVVGERVDQLFVLVPLATTAVGGLTANLLFGPVAYIGYLVAGWGDAIAEPVGRAWGRHRYRVPSLAGVAAHRTLEGSAAVLIVGSLAAFLGLWLSGTDPGHALGVALACGVAGAGVEALSNHGLDNLTVQLAVAASAFLLL